MKENRRMTNQTNVCDPYKELSHDERQWYVFIGISAAIYVGGIILILIGRFIHTTLFNRKRRKEELRKKQSRNDKYVDNGSSWYILVTNFAGDLESGKNLPGKILLALSFIANMAAFGIYVKETSDHPIEYCFDYEGEPHDFIAEIALYIFFLLHFCLRLLSATDKFSFWAYDVYTHIDLLTFPLVFHMNVGKTSWLGLRFLRIIYIQKLPLMLHYLNLLTAGPNLTMGYVVGKFFALILSASGIFHLLENTGDPWLPQDYSDDGNGQKWTYFECVYFMIVTLSTVGYGDYSCSTYLGRIFCMLIIIFGLGLFASYVPMIFDFIASHTKYDRKFKTTPGKKHVVVTGHITDETVSAFVQDFLHPDRAFNNTSVVFLAPNHPSVVIQSILQRYFSKVSYFIGTIYKHHDCERVQMNDADAVIILCDKKCSNPDAEDAANITRVILVKKFYRHVRCIVQVMRKPNKAHIHNCPQWKESNGDAIVCIDELKLGVMAQSCNAPGFSTLLANLFVMREAENKRYNDSWRETYLTGVSVEMYSTTLSDYFVGMSFPTAVEICFSKLNLLLIAVEVQTEKGEVFAINPPKSLKLTKDTRAFFISQDAADVSKAKLYCERCHSNTKQKTFPRCKCVTGSSESINGGSYEKIESNGNNGNHQHISLSIENPNFTSKLNGRVSIASDIGSIKRGNGKLTLPPVGKKDFEMFDETGTYFWCPERSLNDAIMSLDTAEKQKFVGHVVILVISDVRSSSLGLRQLIQPLRASNQPYIDLKKIIILGDDQFLAREWSCINTFPDVHIVKGSPYSRVDLRAINVHTADMCILLSPLKNVVFEKEEHEAMSDKEVIMVTLNLRAMTFESLNKANDTSPPLVKKNISAELLHSKQALAALGVPLNQQIEQPLTGENIRMITELVYDSNTLYMDEEQQSHFTSDGIYMTQSYACGSVFTVSVLDFLASATYFNQDTLTLVRNLVTGSVNPELDNILAEGRQPAGVVENEAIALARNRCRIDQLSLNDPLFSSLGRINEFGDLFIKSIQEYNMLCLGLYRLHTKGTMSTKSLNTRYVITFPSRTMRLEPSDLVFVLMQFHGNDQTKNWMEDSQL